MDEHAFKINEAEACEGLSFHDVPHKDTWAMAKKHLNEVGVDDRKRICFRVLSFLRDRYVAGHRICVAKSAREALRIRTGKECRACRFRREMEKLAHGEKVKTTAKKRRKYGKQ